MFHREQNLNKLKLEGLVSQTQTWWSSISGVETKTSKGPLMGKGFGIYQDSDCIHKGKRCLLFGRKAMTNLDSILKSREITLTTKVCIVKAMVFPVVMYRCESWTIKKAEHQRINAFQIAVLEKTPENPLDSKEIKPINPNGNQPWIFIRRTDIEAEALIFWLSHAKSCLIGKDPDAAK